MADSATTYRVVIFKKRQAKTSDKILGNYSELGNVSAEAVADKSSVKIKGMISTTVGVGYGIITSDNRLCIYKEETVWKNKLLSPLYLMFRNLI